MSYQDKRLLVLIATNVTNRYQKTHQDRALFLLKAKHVTYELVDGMDPSQRQKRNYLFGVSGIRANYPQFFWISTNNENENDENEGGQGKNETISYLGDWSYVEGLNEASTLDKEFLEQYPQIETFDQVFGHLIRDCRNNNNNKEGS